jgi:prolyl-tRNA synthetase
MGHVFKLGTMYSEAIGVYYLDEGGQRQLAVMGCYGIGVERMLAAVIEANHDDNGILWPAEVAPFDVHVVVIGGDDAEVAAAVQEVEATIEAAGLSVLLDDRDDSPGIKFKDADLLGLPVRVTVSPRALKNGGVEFKLRAGGDATVVPLGEVLAEVRKGLGSPSA